MKKTKEELKTYFETGDKPTQEQYADLIDSYIDTKQPAGEANRSFSVDENGEVSLVSANSGGGLPAGFYEEVDFTPKFYATSQDEYTAGSAVGKAVRMGNIVHFNIKLRQISDPSNINSGTGNSGAYITGLPFPNDVAGVMYTNNTTVNYFAATSVETGVDPKNLQVIYSGNLLLIVDAVTTQRVTDISFDGGTFASDLGISGSYITNVYTP
ncbi:hypothetical protein [uncultured Tenacibaculum sp.]|uniref:hypothetical protein n=1 Tax=uncultured Tenacibaculum sp. TaxID=174713 RepID=UPI002628893E|nr:hypothetical protein [uncultured Tenacibaculum sp.]